MALLDKMTCNLLPNLHPFLPKGLSTEEAEQNMQERMEIPCADVAS